MTRHALLYTEMVTSPALVRGSAHYLLDHHETEHPVAVQLGGSDPIELAKAARICADAGYDEINLNIGCPSDRVQSGRFGAILMEDPGLVADCVAAMTDASPLEVTVKCRIGVDDQNPETVLPDFLDKVSAAGVSRFTIHARKAWLKGLSPKENRDVPPLDYELVYAMKRAFPRLHLSINGGVRSLAEAQTHLAAGMDGVMIGRSAYHSPADILLDVDRLIFNDPRPTLTTVQVVEAMIPYIENHLTKGGKLHSVTRHMLGLFAGRPGARSWRRILSDHAKGENPGVEVLMTALAAVSPEKLMA